jgi:hypothetical protein
MYGTVIILDISCGCESWAFSLWEEHVLSVFRETVWTREEVTGGWEKLHDEGIKYYYSTIHVERRRGMGTKFVQNPEGKGSLWIFRRRCEDRIKMRLKKVGIQDVNRINVAQDRVEWRGVSQELGLQLLHQLSQCKGSAA